MYRSFFLGNVGKTILFTTVSNAWVYSTTTSRYFTKKNKERKECKDIVANVEELDFLVDYFNLVYDGETIKNMFNFHLKKLLDK